LISSAGKEIRHLQRRLETILSGSDRLELHIGFPKEMILSKGEISFATLPLPANAQQSLLLSLNTFDGERISDIRVYISLSVKDPGPNNCDKTFINVSLILLNRP